MIPEEEFEAALDTTPEMALVRLERRFRAAYDKNMETDDGSSFRYFSIQYMNHVTAAASELGLNLFDFWSVPTEDDRDFLAEFAKFRRDVDEFAVRTQIAHIRSGRKNSVALDPSEKKHLRAYAEKIKEVIEQSSLPTAKKERLFDKLNAFIAELDRDRTPLQRFTDVIMALSVMGGDAAEELEPAWKWVKLGAAILGVRQETEQAKISAPTKKIEGPKPKLPAPKNVRNQASADDEIPF
jgi:hypothetical protein